MELLFVLAFFAVLVLTGVSLVGLFVALLVATFLMLFGGVLALIIKLFPWLLLALMAAWIWRALVKPRYKKGYRGYRR